MDRMNPFFSVIIPTYKRKASLKECLKAISQISYPNNRFEIIVVNDSNDRGITQALSPFYDRFNLIVLSQKNAGPAAARNNGRGSASGRYLVFTDDDCIPASDWLDALSQRFLKTPNCAITGKTVNALTNNLYSTASQAIIDYLYTYYNMNSDNAQYAISSNLALPTEGFDAIGGFDTDFKRPGGEDRDLCARWLDYGFRIVYAPEVKVHHYHDLSLKLFFDSEIKQMTQNKKAIKQTDRSMKSLEKTLTILKIFLDNKAEMSLSEISTLSGLNKTTVYKIVSTLVKYDYLRQKEKKGKYSLGTIYLNFNCR